jgi:hypothetical protein
LLGVAVAGHDDAFARREGRWFLHGCSFLVSAVPVAWSIGEKNAILTSHPAT